MPSTCYIICWNIVHLTVLTQTRVKGLFSPTTYLLNGYQDIASLVGSLGPSEDLQHEGWSCPSLVGLRCGIAEGYPKVLDGFHEALLS
jgi:hypothetical protein